jgi:hypothetical protein
MDTLRIMLANTAIIILNIQSLVPSPELVFTQKLKYQQPQPNKQHIRGCRF